MPINEHDVLKNHVQKNNLENFMVTLNVVRTFKHNLNLRENTLRMYKIKWGLTT